MVLHRLGWPWRNGSKSSAVRNDYTYCFQCKLSPRVLCSCTTVLHMPSSFVTHSSLVIISHPNEGSICLHRDSRCPLPYCRLLASSLTSAFPFPLSSPLAKCCPSCSPLLIPSSVSHPLSSPSPICSAFSMTSMSLSSTSAQF